MSTWATCCAPVQQLAVCPLVGHGEQAPPIRAELLDDVVEEDAGRS
ncbi:hypothetical protein ACU686_45255 [Yinghuangia aomiensis]